MIGTIWCLRWPDSYVAYRTKDLRKASKCQKVPVLFFRASAPRPEPLVGYALYSTFMMFFSFCCASVLRCSNTYFSVIHSCLALHIKWLVEPFFLHSFRHDTRRSLRISTIQSQDTCFSQLGTYSINLRHEFSSNKTKTSAGNVCCCFHVPVIHLLTTVSVLRAPLVYVFSILLVFSHSHHLYHAFFYSIHSPIILRSYVPSASSHCFEYLRFNFTFAFCMTLTCTSTFYLAPPTFHNFPSSTNRFHIYSPSAFPSALSFR